MSPGTLNGGEVALVGFKMRGRVLDSIFLEGELVSIVSKQCHRIFSELLPSNMLESWRPEILAAVE